MIEKLVSSEYRYGEPEYSRLGEQIVEMKKSLNKQLNQEGQDLLDHLADAYIRQNNAALTEAFTDGFCTAVKLVLEVLSHPTK